jgi:hypothetical protein
MMRRRRCKFRKNLLLASVVVLVDYTGFIFSYKTFSYSNVKKRQ